MAHFCFCLVRKQMLLLIWIKGEGRKILKTCFHSCTRICPKYPSARKTLRRSNPQHCAIAVVFYYLQRFLSHFLCKTTNSVHSLWCFAAAVLPCTELTLHSLLVRECPFRKKLNGHRCTATVKWPPKNNNQQAPRLFSHFFGVACFRTFFPRFHAFFLVFTLLLETNLASRWEGVRLPRASGKSPDFPGSSPNFPGSFSATSPEVLSLWNFTAIQGFPGSFPDFPGSSPDFPGSFPDFPRGQPFLWEA